MILFAFTLPGMMQAQIVYPKVQKTAPQRTVPPYMQRVKFFEENSQAAKVILKNGMTVIVSELRSAPLVAITAHIKSGYLDEPEDQIGVSQVLEQIFARGTTTRAPGIFGKDLQAQGGTFSSEVDLAHTSYGIVTPAAQWKKALEIQADALQNPLLDSEEIKRVINLIALDTKARLQQSPEVFAWQKLLELGIGQRVTRPLEIGNEDSLRGLTREKILQYHRIAYSADRLILIVTGDVTTSEVLNEVVRLFDKERGAGAFPHPMAAPRMQSGMRYREMRGNLSIPLVLMGFQAPPLGSPDYPAVEVLRTILGAGETSTAVRRLRDQKKVVNQVRMDYLALKEFGYLGLIMEAAPKDLDRCEISAAIEMELLRREEPDAETMERALAQLERQYWQQYEAVVNRVHILAHYESLGDWKKMNDYLPRLRQVKPADVVRVAKKYLALEKCSLIEYLPVDAEPRNLTAESAFRILNDLLEPAANQEATDREKETMAAVVVPAVAPVFKSNEIRYPLKRASVLRGPELYIREDHTAPLIHMGFFFPGGVLFEKKENSGITKLMLNSMFRGTKERDPDQIRRQLALYGGQITPVVDRDYFGFQFSILSRNVEGGLSLLADIIQAPKFDRDEVDHQKVLQIATVRRQTNSDFTQAQHALNQVFFRDHAYALDPMGTEASLASLDSNTVREWYKNNVEHRKPIVVIIGDTQGTSLAGYFVSHFSGSRFHDTKLPEEFSKAPGQKATIEKSCGGVESIVALGFAATPFGDEDSYPLIVLQNYFAGVGGRLPDQIRDRQGIATAISISINAGIRGGTIAIFAKTEPSVEESVLKGVSEELRRFLDNPISYREYRGAVNAAVGRFAIDQQNPEAQITMLVLAILSGRSMEWVQEYGSRLQEVKQEDLPEIARRFLNPEKAITVRFHGQPRS